MFYVILIYRFQQEEREYPRYDERLCNDFIVTDVTDASVKYATMPPATLTFISDCYSYTQLVLVTLTLGERISKTKNPLPPTLTLYSPLKHFITEQSEANFRRTKIMLY